MIIDTEGMTFGLGQGGLSYAIYTETALVLVNGKHPRVLYHATLNYDFRSELAWLDRAYPATAGRHWATLRYAQRCNGCPSYNYGGVAASTAYSDICDIIAHYHHSVHLWAKGPSLEQRFLAGLSREAVNMREELPHLRHIGDLTDIGCPRFENLPDAMRDKAWKYVSDAHVTRFHSCTSAPHCCAVECVAMALWYNSLQK